MIKKLLIDNTLKIKKIVLALEEAINNEEIDDAQSLLGEITDESTNGWWLIHKNS